MKEQTQREVSCSSLQPQHRRWMAVVVNVRIRSLIQLCVQNFRNSSFRSAFRRYLFRTSPATTITLNRTCFFPQHYQVNSKIVDQITKLNS